MLEELRATYKGKKVFLTGHTGFKGSWLLTILNLLGAQVKGYALAPESENDLYNLIEGDQKCTSVIGDLRNKELLAKELLEFEPDFVFHLAAQPLVRLSYDIPTETFEVNAIGTANLLDAVRFLKKECYLVLITTDKVYHNNEWDYPYRETDRLGGFDPYSASKACAELVIDCYRNSFFHINNFEEHKKALAVGRAGNVIGGGDWSKDRLLPDIYRALGNHQTVIIRNPSAIRPWQHVLEPLSGYLKLGAALYAQPSRFSEAYNFGPDANDVLSVLQMVELANKTWGSGSYSIAEKPSNLHEAGILKLDISKTVSKLNWQPKTNASQAVQLTTDWYKFFYQDKKQIANYTEKQVFDFMNLL